MQLSTEKKILQMERNLVDGLTHLDGLMMEQMMKLFSSKLKMDN